jgi:hypothetical protein
MCRSLIGTTITTNRCPQSRDRRSPITGAPSRLDTAWRLQP